MAEAFEDFQRQFELFFNRERADSAAVRTILQSLLVSMFGSHPNGTALINDLRANVLATLDQPSSGEATAPELGKMRQATRLRAELFFEELRKIFPGLDVSNPAAN
jgi:hypothetical protein